MSLNSKFQVFKSFFFKLKKLEILWNSNLKKKSYVPSMLPYNYKFYIADQWYNKSFSNLVFWNTFNLRNLKNVPVRKEISFFFLRSTTYTFSLIAIFSSMIWKRNKAPIQVHPHGWFILLLNLKSYTNRTLKNISLFAYVT